MIVINGNTATLLLAIVISNIISNGTIGRIIIVVVKIQIINTLQK